MSAARFRVSGKVQGVWFRASTQQRAVASGLRGFARNLADGSVEVLAVGESGAIDSLQHWLQRGPELAAVSRVEREDLDDAPEFAGFDTL